MKKVYVCYKVSEHMNGEVYLYKGESFNKKYNAEKYISQKLGEWVILTKYII